VVQILGVAVNPVLKEMHGDPAFLALLHRIGLE
jgi:hypothetical protein